MLSTTRSHLVWRCLLLLAVVAGGTVATARPAVAFDCGLRYVSGYGARPIDNGIRFAMQSSVPTRVTVRVSTNREFATTFPHFTFRAASPAGLATSHNFHVSAPGMQSDTLYYYDFEVTDGAGNGCRLGLKDAAVRTMHRHLAVDIISVKMRDDSDYWSAGDIYAGHFKVRNAPVWYSAIADRSWSSGETYDVPLRLTATDPPSGTYVALQLIDDDSGDPPAPGIDTTGLPRSFDNGSNDDWDWATASTYLSVWDIPAGGTKSFTMSVSSHLSFVVNASATAWYYA